jgi:diaminopimelate epimerase
MERQISYYMMDPTKNMTILVETPVPEASFPFVAEKLMEIEPSAEQVGFVRGDGSHHFLQMAGGEFCGNASMSAAVYYAIQEELSKGAVLLKVSGAADPVEVQVEKQSESWSGRVHMPKPVSIAEEGFPDGSVYSVVRFEGIAHVIIDRAGIEAQQLSIEALKQDPARAEALAASWCEHLHADAIGLMFLNEPHDEMQPLVYVPAAGTCIWESSCASGTTAAGAYLARQTGAACYRLQQPGGTLEIEVTPEGEYYLMGQVSVRERKEVLVEHNLL